MQIDGAAVWLLADDGTRLVNLVPDLMVSHRRYRSGRLLSSPRRGRWLRFARPQLLRHADGGWDVTAMVRTSLASFSLKLSFKPGTTALRLVLVASYAAELLVSVESARFGVGPLDRLVMLDRAYRWRRVRGPIRTGPLTPHRVRLGRGAAPDVSLVGRRGVQGLTVLPRPGRRFTLDLELDNADNHPLRYRRDCFARSLRSRRLRMGSLSDGYRAAGASREVEVDWLVGETPILVGRYPRGFAAAIVLSDHADQSNAERAEALAFGRTGALADGEVGASHPGLVNRELRYTKSIFIQRARGYAPQFDDLRYRAVLGALARSGVEIGVHSPSGRVDRPDEARRLLRRFREVYPGRTWIDHQPDTNCEAVTNSGWDRTSPWYMLGHLHALGFRYIWSGQDLRLSPSSLNLLAPELPAARRPVLFRHPRIGGHARHGDFTFFSSAMLFERRRRLLRRLGDDQLDRLAEERGLLIGHVYLDTGVDRPRFRDRALIEPMGAGGYRLRPEVDRLFRRLQARQRAGEIWVTGVEALAAHLQSAVGVELDPLTGGELRVSLGPGDPRPVSGLTLLVPRVGVRALVDGTPPAGTRVRGGVTELWFDVQPDRPRLVRLLDSEGAPLELASPGAFSIQ